MRWITNKEVLEKGQCLKCGASLDTDDPGGYCHNCRIWYIPMKKEAELI